MSNLGQGLLCGGLVVRMLTSKAPILSQRAPRDGGNQNQMLGSSDDRDPHPNYARFPSDALFRSTTGGTDPSSAHVRHSNRGGGLRPHGCARPFAEPPGRIVLPPFLPRAGTSICHRRAPAVQLLRTAKARPPLLLRLLFFRIFESRLSPLLSVAETWLPIGELHPSR